MLKLYNSLSEGEAVGLPAGPDPLDPTDLNGAHFDPEVYVDKLPRECPLAQLMDSEADMVQQIRALDSDMQTLVYENYYKFIPATEIDKQHKTTSQCQVYKCVRNWETIGLQPGWGGEEVQGLARAGLATGKGQRPPGPGQLRAAQVRDRRGGGARERPAEGAREPGAARGGARAGPDAQVRPARTHRARAQTPQIHREAACSGSFFFPKCRQSPRSHGQAFRQLRSDWQVPRQGWPAQEGGGRRASRREEAAAVAGGGSAQPQDCEDGEDAPRPGREETGTQTGGDGRGTSQCQVYKCVRNWWVLHLTDFKNEAADPPGGILHEF
ncbi:uncharacterized protein LOC134731021 [Pan paniscus]|uniref:uncharacterized protein LOC134731021 n=1 Tax=Pan paniscus TaxID=9597 RepID=UPI0030047ACA